MNSRYHSRVTVLSFLYSHIRFTPMLLFLRFLPYVLIKVIGWLPPTSFCAANLYVTGLSGCRTWGSAVLRPWDGSMFILFLHYLNNHYANLYNFSFVTYSPCKLLGLLESFGLSLEFYMHKWCLHFLLEPVSGESIPQWSTGGRVQITRPLICYFIKLYCQ